MSGRDGESPAGESDATLPPAAADRLVPRTAGGLESRALRLHASGRTRSLDWFPVTAELSSTTRERLRGVLVDARLGVTGRVWRLRAGQAPPHREFILPVMIERGSTIRERLRGLAPGFPEVGDRA